MPDRPTSSPGFYKSKLRPDGADVPIKTWLEDGDRDDMGKLMSDQIIRCRLGDTMVDPFEPLAEGRSIDWRDTARPITRDEYHRLMVLGHDETQPAATPEQAIGLDKRAPIF